MFTDYITRYDSRNSDPDLNDRDKLEISPALGRCADEAGLNSYRNFAFHATFVLFRENYFTLDSRVAL
jgi:hypothetical protein